MTFLFMLEMESSGKIAGWGWGMFVVILARNRICFTTFCILTAGQWWWEKLPSFLVSNYLP